jgi:predicted nucleic acid-binding protein
MQVVIDASAILAVLLRETRRDALVRATTGVGLVSPASTPWEIGNALVAGIRRRRLGQEQVLAAWASLTEIPLRLVEVDMPRALRMAAASGLYAYDAYVLETACARRLPLLSLDRQLVRAAREAGVTVMEV